MTFKIKFCFMIVAVCAVISSCKDVSKTVTLEKINETFPSISKQFFCLPDNAAFIAAHRGTSKNSKFPENSLSALQALIEKGFLFAEIDIASIKDKTHILYHDDNWNDKSTGTGLVKAASKQELSNVRLKDTRGKLSNERAPTFSEILKAAQNKIYLEIDFKPSAKYETVISDIRKAGMEEYVILISYSAGQAAKLARLAPEMRISISAKTDAEIKSYESAGVSPEKMAVWRGRSGVNSKLLDRLRRDGIPILRQEPKSGPRNTAKVASLIVSDYAFKHKPIIGLTKKTRLTYEDCLKTP